jgi:hypothetical protein
MLKGSRGTVNAVAVTPDGRWVVSGADDQTLRVWDLESGECLRTLTGHESYVLRVQVTPDGRSAVSGGFDGLVKVWDLASGRCLATRRCADQHVRDLAVAGDGGGMVSCGQDGRLRVWTLPEADEIARYQPPGEPRCCALGAPDPFLTVGDQRGGVHLMRLEGHGASAPLVTPTRRWDHIEGTWAEALTLKCPHCGRHFPAALAEMATPQVDAVTARDGRCGLCGGAIRVTPFVCDNRGWVEQMPELVAPQAAGSSPSPEIPDANFFARFAPRPILPIVRRPPLPHVIAPSAPVPLSAPPPPAPAPPPAAPMRAGAETGLRYDGLYRWESPTGLVTYLRFYADGTVLSVSTDGTTEQVARWFDTANQHVGRGRYRLEEGILRFSTSYPSGSVDYEGTVLAEGLQLAFHSHFTDTKGSQLYRFVSVPLS